MGKKCLGTYTSFPGNTEKVALRFKETFEKNGWQCDIFKVGKKANDILRPPFDIHQYDFVCAGSWLRAYRRTLVPIMLHSYALEQVARQQLAILKDEGADLKWVTVDHVNNTTDLEYLTWLLEQHCYLGMDRYLGLNLSVYNRTKTLKLLIDTGWIDRLLLSHDCGLVSPEAFYPPDVKESIEKGNPYGYLYLKKAVFPELREMGVTEAALNTLCVNGPRNFFEGV